MTFIATLFEGRRAIVMGGTSGIGAGTALRLSELGASVLAVGLQAIAAEGTAALIVEQDVGLAQSASSRLYCLLEGRVTLHRRSADVGRADITAACFGTAQHAVA